MNIAAGGLLGHSYPVARVMQAGDRRSVIVQQDNVIMATGASDTCSKTNHLTLRWLPQEVSVE